MGLDEQRAANRANWDDRVAIHWDAPHYRASEFIAHPDRISLEVEMDRPVLGDVHGKRLVHLQCHFGMDTLSWARLGAEVTGIDLSPRSIEAAKRLSRESGTPGRFIEADVYDAADVLDERFDIVFTGVGALCWLPDIAGWAEVVARLMGPGGTFYIREGHPVLWALDYERDDDALVITEHYFEAEPSKWEEGTTYTGEGSVEHATTYQWNHGLGEIVGALLAQGLTLTHFEEHDYCYWPAMEHMDRDERGIYRLPQDRRTLLPLMYTLMATK